MNILFVHEVDWLDKVVFDFHSLSELLSSFGHNVFVIDFASLRNRNGLLDFGTLKTQEFKFAGRAHKNASISLIRPGYIKAPFLDRVSAFFTHYFAIEKAIKKYKIDIVVLYSVPTNGYQAISLAKKHGIPVVFRSIDVLHELVPSKVFGPLTFSLETWVYRHADKILTLSPGLSDYVIRMNADKDKVDLLLFGVDLSKFNPCVESNGLRESFGLSEDDLVVLYIGTLFEFSGLGLYLEQFPKVVKKIPKAKLVIVGGGPLFDRLKKRVSELQLSENVILTGFQPFDVMPKFINIADLCINPFEVNNATRNIIPGKILQYLACGKPVLATPLPSVISLLDDRKHDLFFSSIADFSKNTIMLLENKETAKRLGENGFQYIKDNHDEEKLAHRLETILYQEIQEIDY